MNTNNVSKILFVLAIGSFMNCIAYTSDLLQKPNPVDPATVTVKPKVFLKTSFKIVANGNNAPINVAFQNNWTNAIVGKAKNIGLFSEITNNEFATDYVLDIALEDNGEANQALAVLTGLTLYIFPSTASDHFKMTMTVYDGNGTKIGSVFKEEKIVLWQQLLLIFGMPFYYFPSTVRETQDALITSTFAEAYHQGYFSKAKPKKK
ncbi:hypothetical protein EHQ76_13355 [Leptospira barantonii]|uniref:Lipoprotein n=1 Tax=Leptospira barantonii TaxID=2023184 RepID=A0A5F2B1A3_9LEPT|nr:hypothetical protein [Leptospira barantonii]TGL98016.1 hypothetical protein EHQ76_13355 [Leptospira barantonii]